MDGDPDRKATGFTVGQLPESSAITPGGRDTYKTAQGYRKATGFSVVREPESTDYAT